MLSQPVLPAEGETALVEYADGDYVFEKKRERVKTAVT